MLARSIRSTKLVGLLVSALMVLLLSGCGEESTGGGGTQADGGRATEATEGFGEPDFASLESGGGTQADSSGTHLTADNMQKVDDLIAQAMQDNNLPGVVVGVWTPDEGEYVSAQGHRKPRHGESAGAGGPVPDRQHHQDAYRNCYPTVSR